MSIRATVLPCLLCAVLAGASACGGPSTTIEQSWTAPGARRADLRNVLTLYISRDGAMRRSVEDAMAQKLARAGVRATPSYRVLSEEDLGDRERVKDKLRAAGYDGVVAIRLVSREQEVEYVPGSFDTYWGPAWATVYDPGYAYTETIVRVETSAFSLADDKLVWSALSRTVDPDSPRETIDEVTTAAANALQQQGIVASTRAPAPEA